MGTLPRSRSSVIRNKNLSMDEGTALSDLHIKVGRLFEEYVHWGLKRYKLTGS